MIKGENRTRCNKTEQIHRDTQHRSTAGTQHGMCLEYNNTPTAL